MVDSASEPTRLFCDGMLKRYGVGAIAAEQVRFHATLRHRCDVGSGVCRCGRGGLVPADRLRGSQKILHHQSPGPRS